MIVKGHDFPKVTLVGVLAADLSLCSGDYRAGEKTFQLLLQAVGRAGRGEKPGEAVIQTYHPDHYCIQAAAAQDYEGFYEEEIAYLLEHRELPKETVTQSQAAHEASFHILNKEEAKAEEGGSDKKDETENGVNNAETPVVSEETKAEKNAEEKPQEAKEENKTE